ncbi:VanZ family protein [Maritimibacter sp. DP07]|uniref:VanZ family protein n=1 Tax=Maritimibacter harenae TaxID=2606218 RepID=A0A845M7A1_9RHOB|nr:VanZ family protein [Maritimibacter harenae]MZR13373.1 VanZ family protein [Maritimibacter harenae]
MTRLSTRTRRTIWAAITVALAAAIAYLTLVPRPPSPVQFPHVDKLYHALAFAALVFPTTILRPRWWGRMAVLAIGYGALIELVQPLFGRDAEWLDLVFDGLGVAVGTLAGVLLLRLVRPRARA